MIFSTGLHRVVLDVAGLLLAAVLVVWAVVPDDFVVRMASLGPHLLIQAAIFPFVASAVGANRTVWRFSSLEDLGGVALAIVITIFFSLGVGFVVDRLDPVFRSLPILQGAIAVLLSWVMRALFVLRWRSRSRFRKRSALCATGPATDIDHILIVGMNELANLYISGITEFAGARAEVVGLLSEVGRHEGRLLQQCKVLGKPVDAIRLIAELLNHGVVVNRIVVAMPFDHLSKESREVLLDVERAGGIELVMLSELLGLKRAGSSDVFAASADPIAGESHGAEGGEVADMDVTGRAWARLNSPPLRPRGYLRLKRVFDFVGAVVLSLLLLPVAMVVAFLVLLNDGSPILFWQKRPGTGGELLRIYKFRTMRGPHDRQGNRRPAAERTTLIGHLLRRFRLDEIPQLYHVLVGQMSFVGPRPLLSGDQCETARSRLSVRPGITGFAQVAGCNRLSVDEKMALDDWYVENMSLALDTSIVLRTIKTLLFGEVRDENAIAAALAARRVRGIGGSDEASEVDVRAGRSLGDVNGASFSGSPSPALPGCSSSLTFPAVHRRISNREQPSTRKDLHRWTSTKP